jgi:predicted nucleotidyltransferase
MCNRSINTNIQDINIHLWILDKIVTKLKNTFTEAGIGISGSVAKRTHTIYSDIDLLLLEKSFIKDRRYIYYTLENIKINILCLNPVSIETKLKQWSFYFTGQHLQYILDAKPLCDKNGMIQQIQEKICTFKKSKLYQKDINELLLNNLGVKKSSNKVNHNFGFKKDSFIKLYSLLNCWFIFNGIELKDKNELRSAFKIISVMEPNLLHLLANYLQNNALLKEQALSENFLKLGIVYPI